MTNFIENRGTNSNTVVSAEFSERNKEKKEIKKRILKKIPKRPIITNESLARQVLISQKGNLQLERKKLLMEIRKMQRSTETKSTQTNHPIFVPQNTFMNQFTPINYV